MPLTSLAGRCDVGMPSMPFGRRPSFAGPALLPRLRRHPGSGTQSDHRQAPETSGARSVDWRSLPEPSVGRFRLRNRSSCRAAPVVFRRNVAILVVVPNWSAITEGERLDVVDLLEPRAWHEVVGHHDTGAEGLRESLHVESGSRDDPKILPGRLGELFCLRLEPANQGHDRSVSARRMDATVAKSQPNSGVRVSSLRRHQMRTRDATDP